MDNDPAALFCVRCTAPLAVVALGELTPADRRKCFAALLQVLADATNHDSPPTSLEHDETLWRSYLSAFWLRPETALILYAEALAIRRANVAAPLLDLGCGDGIHAALYSDWRFDPTFDAFQSLNPTAADIYHHWNPAVLERFCERHAAAAPGPHPSGVGRGGPFQRRRRDPGSATCHPRPRYARISFPSHHGTFRSQ